MKWLSLVPHKESGSSKRIPGLVAFVAVIATSAAAFSPVAAAELVDSAVGSGSAAVPGRPDSPIIFAFEAASGPSGENATGTYSWGNLVDGPVASGPVDCLQINPLNENVAFVAGPITGGYFFGGSYTYAGFNVYDWDPLNEPLSAIQPDQMSGLRFFSDASPGEEIPDCDSYFEVPGRYDLIAGFIDVTNDATVTPPGPAAVTLSPAASVNPVGTEHTVTATVTNADGGSVSDATVLFTVRGSTTTSGSCTTNAMGQCDLTYSGPQLPGADVISGCADSDNDGVSETGEPCGEAIKAWILPASTPGQVTGGGYILDPLDNEKVSFGFNAQSTSNGLKGNCTIVDAAPARNVKIKCLTVTSLVQTATHATFFGQAEVSGVVTDYRIDVDDNAEPGRGIDTFKIVTGSGYSAAGILDGGNIQVHRAE